MELKMLELLETAAIAVSGFMIKKYIFLEPDMETKKQRIFYLLSFLVTGIVFFAFGKDAASLAALIMIGLNICLGRETHKVSGLLMMIPFPGIINGLFVPLMLVPPYLLAFSDRGASVYQFVLYGVLAAILVLFYVKGKSWRSWFNENMRHRGLRSSEKAPLHDIGKIHIPDAVLNKPGRLTDEEFEIMKTHNTEGEKLLRHAKAELGDSGYLDTALEMAAYHHEWWNGKGYPYGISGDEIPLCARIMAVADVFDALTSKRCYKNAMPLEKAYAIIRDETGTHFEPAVVDAFFAAEGINGNTDD